MVFRNPDHPFAKAATLYVAAATLLLTSCATTIHNQAAEIPGGEYVQREANGTRRGVFLFHSGDSLLLVPLKDKLPDPAYDPTSLIPSPPGEQSVKLSASNYDLDIFTTPFKYRPADSGVPPQINTTFNASLYLGYRKDFLKLTDVSQHPRISSVRVKSFGFGIGVFSGLGSVNITSSALATPLAYDYDAGVWNYGMAFLVGYRQLSTGIAVGWDYLLDHNRDVWIYQNDPWLGVFIGLNVN